MLALNHRAVQVLKPPGILPIQCQQASNIARNQFLVLKLLCKRIVSDVESFQMLQLPKIQHKVSLEFLQGVVCQLIIDHGQILQIGHHLGGQVLQVNDLIIVEAQVRERFGILQYWKRLQLVLAEVETLKFFEIQRDIYQGIVGGVDEAEVREIRQLIDTL